MTDTPDCRITKTDVIIGDTPIPGLIREGGVTVKPGRRCNIVTVELIVGEITVEDR